MPRAQAGTRRTTTWGRERRLAFIDYRLCWEGRINRGDLQEFFGISVPQASADLKAYQELAPANMAYDATEKCYVAKDGFVPQLSEGESYAYLNELLSRETGLLADNATFIGLAPEMGYLQPPYRHVPTGVLRAILKAWRSRHAVYIHYQSMSRPEPTWRLISPHALAHDGLRYHVRAYCHLREEFRDFVLSRVLDVREGEDRFVDPGSDWKWHKEVEVRIKAHHGLTEAQRVAVAREYDMEAGEKAIPVRLALLFYLLLRLRLRGQDPEAKPWEIQIELANPAEVKSWEALARSGDGSAQASSADQGLLT